MFCCQWQAFTFVAVTSYVSHDASVAIANWASPAGMFSPRQFAPRCSACSAVSQHPEPNPVPSLSWISHPHFPSYTIFVDITITQ